MSRSVFGALVIGRIKLISGYSPVKNRKSYLRLTGSNFRLPPILRRGAVLCKCGLSLAVGSAVPGVLPSSLRRPPQLHDRPGLAPQSDAPGEEGSPDTPSCWAGHCEGAEGTLEKDRYPVGASG